MRNQFGAAMEKLQTKNRDLRGPSQKKFDALHADLAEEVNQGTRMRATSLGAKPIPRGATQKRVKPQGAHPRWRRTRGSNRREKNLKGTYHKGRKNKRCGRPSSTLT